MVPPQKKKLSPLAEIKEIESDEYFRSLVSKHLPPNYDFEIGKTVWRIRKNPDCKTVALQFPEGLLIFSTKIGLILTKLTGVDVILMGDITYGACCVDDHTASMLGADLLVHYGHSCLVPVAVANKLDTIYVFVTISYNMQVAVQSITNLISDKMKQRREEEEEADDNSSSSSRAYKVLLVSTIQFAGKLGELKEAVWNGLGKKQSGGGGGVVEIVVPRSKPLSNGEILGCTAPKIPSGGGDLIVYVGDGRFHLEAMMMANPGVEAYRYDPYNTTLTLETFDHATLAQVRTNSISRLLLQHQRTSEKTSCNKQRIGVILGTLGRQGNPKPMNHVYECLSQAGFSPFVILMSEVMPAKLQLLTDVSGFVQFACPRLSIDWGDAFHVPVLTSYEATLLAKQKRACSLLLKNHTYSHPMDYYAYDSSGPHTPNYKIGI